MWWKSPTLCAARVTHTDKTLQYLCAPFNRSSSLVLETNQFHLGYTVVACVILLNRSVSFNWFRYQRMCLDCFSSVHWHTPIRILCYPANCPQFHIRRTHGYDEPGWTKPSQPICNFPRKPPTSITPGL